MKVEKIMKDIKEDLDNENKKICIEFMKEKKKEIDRLDKIIFKLKKKYNKYLSMDVEELALRIEEDELY